MDKLSRLLKSDQKLLHTQDLAVLWEIENKNTLRVTISRYIKKNILFKVFRGLYSLVPVEEIDKYLLGSKLVHRFCYLSCESVLFNEGVINQPPSAITFVSSLSRRIKINKTMYFYRKAKPEILFNPMGVSFADGYYRAGRERAIADMKYFRPSYYFDNL